MPYLPVSRCAEITESVQKRSIPALFTLSGDTFPQTTQKLLMQLLTPESFTGRTGRTGRDRRDRRFDVVPPVHPSAKVRSAPQGSPRPVGAGTVGMEGTKATGQIAVAPRRRRLQSEQGLRLLSVQAMPRTREIATLPAPPAAGCRRESALQLLPERGHLPPKFRRKPRPAIGCSTVWGFFRGGIHALRSPFGWRRGPRSLDSGYYRVNRVTHSERPPGQKRAELWHHPPWQ